PDEAGLAITEPSTFADEERLQAALALLRREDPVHRVEAEDFPPFWLVTRHGDVMDVETKPEIFRNEPEPVLQNYASIQRAKEQGGLLRTLIHMDAPDHLKYRGLTADWFQPKSLGRLDGRLAELAQASLARMGQLGGECDFARDITMQYPLQ